ncbi:RNA polymerase sigma factor [Desulfitibacter alkalitolerans]|uniref:RNA polymerase sigma factor n=1 Tax=Desulfitibacter alkalitolerans TaxID=264641 RepID=UPI00146F9669|nr:sigma-70 family RNA polymerase sigma factor [Desulfitibacter alkalitolerans]
MEILFKLHYERVYKSTFIATGDAELSKEATQEAFCEAFRNIDTLKDKTKFPAWVSAIAVNKAVDIIRKNNQANRIKNKAILYYMNFNAHNPEDQFFIKESRNEMITELRTLPEKYTEVLLLKFYHNLSEQEISCLLKIPNGTVKSRIHRAKEILKKAFEDKQSYGKVINRYE